LYSTLQGSHSLRKIKFPDFSQTDRTGP